MLSARTCERYSRKTSQTSPQTPSSYAAHVPFNNFDDIYDVDAFTCDRTTNKPHSPKRWLVDCAREEDRHE